MRRFFKKILYFFLPIIILAIPIDYTVSYFLRNSFVYPGELEVMNDIYSGEISCDIAIYGSSRAWVHINPKLIEDSLNLKAYNFGIDGHNFWLQYLRHLELIKFNSKPKLIILSLDVFSLQKRKDLYELNQFLPFMLWDNDIRSLTSSYNGFNTIDYYIPLVRYAGKTTALNSACKTALSQIINIPRNPIRYKGFAGMDKEWNNDIFEKTKAAKNKYVINLDANSIKLFETFINECKENNIELILVYTPEYIERPTFFSNRDEIINLYNSFSIKYNLPLLDYSTDVMCYNKSLFYNANHLNRQGADIFTAKLIGDIKVRMHNNLLK